MDVKQNKKGGRGRVKENGKEDIPRRRLDAHCW